MSDTKAPIEGKVYAATVGAGASATVSAFVLWLLGVTFWGIPNTAERAADAITAVPAPVNGILVLAITAGSTFLAGYITKHTPRPQPEADGAVIIEHGPQLLKPTGYGEGVTKPEGATDGPMQLGEVP